MLASIPASRLNHTPPDSDILNDSQQPHPALGGIVEGDGAISSGQKAMVAMTSTARTAGDSDYNRDIIDDGRGTFQRAAMFWPPVR